MNYQSVTNTRILDSSIEPSPLRAAINDFLASSRELRSIFIAVD